METKGPVDWTKLVVALSAIIATLAILTRWIGGMIENRIMDRLNDPNSGPLALLDKRMDELEKTSVRFDTWFDINKAMLASHGGALHASPFEINTNWLREKIVSSGYVPDPVMLEEFKRLVRDPETPEDDGALWHVIELRFGTQELSQEVMRFNAPGETAPAIWILCIRKAQEIGADELLREIGLLSDEAIHDDGA